MSRRLIRQIISLFQPAERANTGDTIRLSSPEPPFPNGILNLAMAMRYLENAHLYMFEAVTPDTYLVVSRKGGDVVHMDWQQIIAVAQHKAGKVVRFLEPV